MTAERRVRCVRLRATRHEHVSAGARLVEDALRTTTFPDAGIGVLVIRSLDIGRIRPSAGPVQVAQAMSRALGAVPIVHAADATAGSAPAVMFQDEIQPVTLMALRVLRRQPHDEWFWKRALPDWIEPASTGDAIVTLLGRAAAGQAGVAAAMRVVAELIDARQTAELIAALEPRHGQALLRLFGWSDVAANAGAAARPAIGETSGLSPQSTNSPAGIHRDEDPAYPSSPDPATHTMRDVLPDLVHRWGDGDSRTLWLSCVLLVLDRPARLADAGLPVRARRLASELCGLQAGPPVRERRPGTNEVSPDAPPPRASIDHAAGVRARGTAHLRPDTRPIGPANASRTGTRLTQSAGVDSARDATAECPTGPPLSPPDPPRTAAAEPHESWLAQPSPSANAGLIFVVPLLDRARIRDVLERGPDRIESDFVGTLIGVLARRFRLTSDDAAFTALAGRDARLPVTSPQRDRRALANCVRSLRTLSRELAGRSLRSLVRRSGRIRATRTHIDVFFDLTDLDVRIRKAGLDIDPGWVPWLGRVIRFHYVEEP